MNTMEEIKNAMEKFRLPKYEEIPNVGLYLEQVSKYITEYLEPLGEFSLTGSMISNYVKKNLVSNPVKKQYSREQIAYFIFIAIAKTVLSMEDIRLLIELQKNTYPPEVAYRYLEEEFENVLGYVFGINQSPAEIEANSHEAKKMLRTVIITIAHKVYLDKCFKAYRSEQ